MFTDFYLFADDTSMLYANKNLRELENKVNIERGNLCDWLKANKPFLSIKNSNFVIFQSRQKSLPFIPCTGVLDYEMNSHKPLEVKGYVKYLGVYIDADLSWKHRIEKKYYPEKSKCVGVIAKLRHFVPRQALLSIFQSLISPYLAKVLKSIQQIIDN